MISFLVIILKGIQYSLIGYFFKGGQNIAFLVTAMNGES